MSHLKLIDAAPVEGALAEIRKLETSARDVSATATAEALGKVAKLVEAALEDAANPDMSEGIDIQEYANAHRISKSAVYKRIYSKRVPAKKGPDGWRVLVA